MEVGDWRTQLPAESRRKMVDNFIPALKRYFPFFGLERLQRELEKTAVRFEEEIYTAAKTQVDYMEQISLKMQTLETIPDISLQTAENEGSFDATDHIDSENGGDWQEEIYQKIKCVKDLYIVYVKDLHQRALGKLQQKNSVPNKELKEMLEQFMGFLEIPKQNIVPNHIIQLGIYEKQILYAITSHHWKAATSQPPVGPTNSQQQQHLLQPPVQVQVQPTQQHVQVQERLLGTQGRQYLTGQSSRSRGQQKQRHFKPQTSSTSLDWQEEVYQKIKAMKDLYQPDLIHIYHAVIENIQEEFKYQDERFEKLKSFKEMLENLMAFLQTSKQNIKPYLRDNFTTYEEKIIQIITTNPWKPAATQPPPPPPPPLPPSDMH